MVWLKSNDFLILTTRKFNPMWVFMLIQRRRCLHNINILLLSQLVGIQNKILSSNRAIWGQACYFWQRRLQTILKGPLGMRNFQCCQFEKLIYMKLYSLLILTENTKKSKNNIKAPKKNEIVVFPGRILPCKQNKSEIFSTLHHIFPRIRR